MTRTLTLLPFMLLLFVLPFPGTVALRLACLAVAFLVAIALWRKLRAAVDPVQAGAPRLDCGGPPVARLGGRPCLQPWRDQERDPLHDDGVRRLLRRDAR